MLYSPYAETDLKIKDILHEITDLIGDNPFEIGFYHIFMTLPQNTFPILDISTLVLAQWMQKLTTFLDSADFYTHILVISFKACCILWNVKDPLSLTIWAGQEIIQVIDTAITLWGHDLPLSFRNAVHLIASWCDPPGLTEDVQVFSSGGNLLLGWNSTNDDFTDYSAVGFVLRDCDTQVAFIRKADSVKVGILAHGSVSNVIPYTFSIIDDYGNQSYVSSGYLNTNQSVNIGMSFAGNVTEFGNHLEISVDVSNAAPTQGEPVIIHIAVNDTAGQRADAAVTLLVNSTIWMTATNLGFGKYEATIDTSNLTGLVQTLHTQNTRT